MNYRTAGDVSQEYLHNDPDSVRKGNEDSGREQPEF